jgi:demethylspheroidene O-methyltransferase
MSPINTVEMPGTPHTNGVPETRALSWSDRWFAFRNGLLARPRFQRWAASFPLTRSVSKRRARALFDVVAGFVYSQILLACVKLDLFEILSNGPQTLSALAPRLGLSDAAAQRLLAAAESLNLVERRSGDRYGLGVLGAPMVGNAAIIAMVEHHAALYADLADPVALLQGKAGAVQLAGFWPYANAQAPRSLTPERVAGYSVLMSESQPLVAHEILDSYAFNKHRRLLDIGGGEGTFLIQVAEKAPELKLVLFDLPAVAERAHARMATAGLAHRTETLGGDFFVDALPGGADVATLVRVLHDHDDDRVMVLLRAAHAALVPGGTLVVAEPMAATAGVEPMGDAYFGFYLLAMGRGQPRSFDKLKALLQAAGFSSIRLLKARMPLQTRVLVAQSKK